MASPFKIGFDISDWKDVLPSIPTDYSKIINSEKDDILTQTWNRQPFPNIITPDFIMQEEDRIKNGVWILIKGMLIWIPPNYYFFLQYGSTGGDDPQFRLKRLKNVYEKIRARKNARFMGTFNIKNRQDGDTTFSMCMALWEIISGNLNNGLIGIQSKTRDDAILPCWFTLLSHWNSFPKFIKDTFYPHFTSGNNTAEKLKFSQEADPKNPNDRGKNVEIFYGPAKHNAFDGKNNMRLCILDEICKWPLEADLLLTITNYKKFIMPGKIRKGLFDMFSSPADTNGKWNDNAYTLWKNSNPEEIADTGSTRSRIYRMYANPLDGIDGFFDEFGDADPEEVHEHILKERASQPKDKLMAEVRGYPLPIVGTSTPNEDELFGATDTNAIFINMAGIIQRKTFVKANKKNLVAYGNLVWENGVIDSGDPIFEQADVEYFDEEKARFCITETTNPIIELRDLKEPPRVVEEVVGVDPFGLRYKTKNISTGSLGAAISWKFRNLLDPLGKVDYPTLTYLSRPWHEDIFHEDMIKLCVYRRAMLQVENSTDKLESYFDKRGYIDWLIDSRDAKPIETPEGVRTRKGDAPSGRGSSAFMTEGLGLINGHTSKSISPDKPCLLEYFNFEEVLEDLEKFNLGSSTQFNHFTMALIQALLGKTKLMFQKRRKKSSVNDQILSYFNY